MFLRVISGEAKGKRLKVPKGNIRPLSDRARESLFNILAPIISDSRFLDLFAGSGAVGIEALSRGAKIAFFVELDKKSVPIIWENLDSVGFSERAEVFAVPVFQALKILSKKQANFDIIFIGAPYGSPSLTESLKYLGNSSLVSAGGMVIAEHRFKTDLPQVFGVLGKMREERYGDTVFSFYKVNHENSNLPG